MCETCGCETSPTRLIEASDRLLAANDVAAEHNREHFATRGIYAVNLMGSPGSGKTTLLEALIRRNAGRWRFAVIEGDQATDLDAQRIAATGTPVFQVETGAGCHLDAHQVHHALEHLPAEGIDFLVIENVGNLVCPALFDLGEHLRVVVTSPPEGTDKPLKYPPMFRAADLVVLNKLDLLPHVPFDLPRWQTTTAAINPQAATALVSALTGEGLEAIDGMANSAIAAAEELLVSP